MQVCSGTRDATNQKSTTKQKSTLTLPHHLAKVTVRIETAPQRQSWLGSPIQNRATHSPTQMHARHSCAFVVADGAP